jgi:hypothetical protein
VEGACGSHGRGKKVSKERGIDERMVSKRILGRLGERVWSGFTWLRIRTDGFVLWTG